MAARTDNSVRTYRVSRVLDLLVTEDRFEAAQDFNLAAYWRDNTERLEAEMHPNFARIRLSEWGARMIPHFNSAYADSRMTVSADPDEKGWVEATLPVGSVRQAATELLRLGPEVEVLEPPELREKMAELTREMASLYSPVHSG
jgi:predicted DNA-binding transcriptional regulator YafY